MEYAVQENLTILISFLESQDLSSGCIFQYPQSAILWFSLGLKINLEKSEMILVGKVDNLEGLACEIGCNVGKLPTSYLGLPLGAWCKLVAVWNEVEERFCKRLLLWKRQHLSKGGRLTLLGFTFASLPIYFMLFVYHPKNCKDETREDSKRFSLGRRGLREQITLSEVVNCL